jgi:hypothetical protein
MDFLIPVSWNVKHGPNKTSSLSNVALDTLKYLKNFCGCGYRSSYREYNFPLVTFDSLLDLPKTSSFLYVSRSKQHSPCQCYILVVHDVTGSVLVRGDCRSSARPLIKNRQRLKSLPRLSQRLKSLVRIPSNH